MIRTVLPRSLIALFCCLAFQPSFSQGCYGVSRSRDKEKGWETYHGAVYSGGWYVSVARQFYRKDNIPPNFYLLIYNGYKKKVDLNKVYNFAAMRIYLTDNSVMHLDSVRYENDPLKEGGGFSVKVYLSEEEVRKLNEFAIVRIYLDDYDILLDGQKGINFLKLVNCLVSKE